MVVVLGVIMTQMLAVLVVQEEGVPQPTVRHLWAVVLRQQQPLDQQLYLLLHTVLEVVIQQEHEAVMTVKAQEEVVLVVKVLTI
jgi:hypothetical protein